VIFIALTMAVLMFLTAYIEIQQSKKETLQALTEEATTLIETISQSAATTILSNIEIENLLANQLLNLGRTLAELETVQGLTRERLSRFAEQNDVTRISLYDRRGRFDTGNTPQPDKSHRLDEPLLDEVEPILDGTADLKVIGLLSDAAGTNSRYAVAVARGNKTGLILLELDSRYLLEFRKRVGIGKLVQDIGDNREIAYVILQDHQGILTASRTISTINRIEADQFLQQAIADDTLLTRVFEFEGVEVFEAVQPFYVESGFYGIFRVGLSMERIRSFNERTIQRLAILSLAVIVVGVIVFGFISSMQSYALLNEEYRKVQTYTGTILDNMGEAVVAANRDGRITVFNKSAEKLFGLTADSVLGKQCAAVIDEPVSCVDRTLQTGTPIEFEETEFRTSRGRRIIVGVSTSIVRNSEGAIDTVVAVIKNLTEQRTVEEQLRRQEKLTAMGELASSVAHEIRNPLNSISMTVQRFAKDFQPKEYTEEYNALVKMMNEEVNRVSTIIQQFLQFARPPKLNPSDVNVGDFIRDVVAVIESEARAKQISIVSELQFSGTIQMDRAQMKQVLLNLVQNALHATGEHGTIRIATKLDNGRLHLVVADTGSGIPPEHLPKIFNLYFTTKPEGTGMGLSMAHQIVTEHGGRIEVESEVGKGTTFTIQMPAL
jgi:PAS domain S-box-containing protein